MTTGAVTIQVQSRSAGCNVEEGLHTLLIGGIQNQQVDFGRGPVMTNHMSSSHTSKTGGKKTEVTWGKKYNKKREINNTPNIPSMENKQAADNCCATAA